MLGVDEGTTGCKSCIYDEIGNLISISSKEYQSYYPKPGYVEQDIFEIRGRVFETIAESIQMSGINPKDIVAISHSNQGITMVLLDNNEKIVRSKTIGWQDIRHTEILPDIRKSISDDEYFEIAGMCLGTYNIAVLNWLQRNEPDLWAKVTRCCSHQDFFLRQYGASGYFIDEGSANFLSMTGVYDCEWKDRLISIYNIDKSYLPTIVHSPGKIVGHISKEVSEKTGLSTDCLVCLGGLDTNCSLLGAGASEPGTDVLIVGTAGVSILVSDSAKLDPNKRVTLRTNPGIGNWQYYIMTNTAASSFRWFRDELCSMEVATSKLIASDPYDIMTSMAMTSKPGANGVTALTCLQGSHGRRKNENARGSILGITLGTSKADIAEAIMEGITFEMRDILDMQSELSKIDRVRLCGGVAKSYVWCQMFADILRKPIELTKVAELGSLGAAMCAGIGAGVYRDCRNAIDNCVRIVKTYYPNEHNFASYDNAFQRWKEAYEAVNNSFYLTAM